MHGSGMHGGGSSSGMARPGMARPGMAQPGMAQPAMGSPRMAMPGMHGGGMHGSAMGMPGASGFGMAPADVRTPMVVLFRYFDTVVEPGAAYRYRVRLKALKPNFGLSLDQVANPSSSKGSSAGPSGANPATPSSSRRHGLRHGQGPRKSGRPEPAAGPHHLPVEQRRGTLVTDTLKSVYGQLVGGKKKTKVLDVAKPSLSDEEIAIRGSDILVDSLGVAGLTSVASTTGASPTLKAAFDDLRIDKNQWVKLIDGGSLDLSVTVNPPASWSSTTTPGWLPTSSGWKPKSNSNASLGRTLRTPPPRRDRCHGLDAYMESVAGAGHVAGMHGGGDPKDKKKKKGKAYNPARMGAMGSSEMGMMPGMAMPGMAMRGCPCLERPHRAPRARKASSPSVVPWNWFQNPPPDRSASPPFEGSRASNRVLNLLPSPASARTTRARFVPRSGLARFPRPGRRSHSPRVRKGRTRSGGTLANVHQPSVNSSASHRPAPARLKPPSTVMAVVVDGPMARSDRTITATSETAQHNADSRAKPSYGAPATTRPPPATPAPPRPG